VTVDGQELFRAIYVNLLKGMFLFNSFVHFRSVVKSVWELKSGQHNQDKKLANRSSLSNVE